LEVTLDAPATLPALPAAVEVAAYRIATEAVTNTVRHARASVCAIRIATEPSLAMLRLEVSDDGCGLLVGRQVSGVGLTSMHERATELGGSCIVKGTPGRGTHVNVLLPLGVDGR
ncbi:MAG: sensor histidine kinase, partial [Pseudonocardiaceae bacterium]